MIPRPPRSTHFPYTTLFRSARREHHRPDAEKQVEEREQARHDDHDPPHAGTREASHRHGVPALTGRTPPAAWRPPGRARPRPPARPHVPPAEGTHPRATRIGSSPAARPDARDLPV